MTGVSLAEPLPGSLPTSPPASLFLSTRCLFCRCCFFFGGPSSSGLENDGPMERCGRWLWSVAVRGWDLDGLDEGVFIIDRG